MATPRRSTLLLLLLLLSSTAAAAAAPPRGGCSSPAPAAPPRAGKRWLPPGSIIGGYAPSCNATAAKQVLQAVRDGVNLVYWFSVNLVSVNVSGTPAPAVSSGLDLACIAAVTAQLAAEGLNATHVVTVGGWDAPHPVTGFSPAAMYAAWASWNEAVVGAHGFTFDGIDWDMEGFDDPANPDNSFTVACLDLVGQFSLLAQADGYILSLVPPESYLDPTTSLYDRSLLWAYPEWHPEFKYHGHNAYALLLAKYATTALPGNETVPTFDLVAVQFYESWSHADYNLTAAPVVQSIAQYLSAWVPRIVNGWFVDFASDPPSQQASQVVRVPASSLILGLANGWAGGPKCVLMMPDDLAAAWRALGELGCTPRGAMFWAISEEGIVPINQTAPLFFARGLNGFLHTRESQRDV